MRPRYACIGLFVSLAACGAPHGGGSLLPDAQYSTAMRQHSEVKPGDNPRALPGDNPRALPGAQLGCDLTFEADKANCTIAINITIPPVSNVNTPANFLAGLHPSDLQNRYGLLSEDAGGTVAIVDAYDDPLAETDLAIYRKTFGLSACTTENGCFRKLNQDGEAGSYPQVNIGWDEEISLDLDMVSAVCPSCKILLVEANSPTFEDLGAAVNEAAAQHAVAISNSYYGPEWSGETKIDPYYTHRGIAITVSAGDQVSTFYPAASPDVTSVGGTTLSGTVGSWAESAWADGGQGCSAYEARPSWQGTTGCATRSTVDVAAVADPATGVTMYDSTAGGFVVAGGTSVGAPLVAAAYALSRNPQAPAYSYTHRAYFHDIPPAGYDLPTGVGTPNGVRGL